MTEIPNNNNKDSDDFKIDETKSLVNQLFSDLEENQAVPDAAKTLLLNLKDPFIKIALDTPNLFAIENHHARVFLAHVCQQSIDWSTVEDNNKLYLKKLKSTVEKIRAQTVYDSKDFIRYQTELDKSLVKLRKRAAVKLKREQEKLLGQKKIKQAKEATAKLITNKINQNTKTADFIKAILADDWTSVLVLLHIRNGSDSEEYKANIAFIDLLLTLSSKQEPLDGLQQKFKLLLKKYSKGLTLVAFNKQEIKSKQNKLLHFLKSIHQPKPSTETIKPKKLQVKETTADETTNAETSEIPAQEQKPKVQPKIIHTKKEKNLVVKKRVGVEKPTKTPVAQKAKISKSPSEEKIDYAQIVDNLKIGSWIEIKAINDKSLKAKLSWVSPISGKHLFVNAQGLKILDKNRAELIEGLTNKTIKIINKI